MDYVINKKTNRLVKVGGKAWRSLMKSGDISDNDYQDPNELDDIDENETEREVSIKISKANKKLPKNEEAVRGRGHHKNKIVKKYKSNCKTVSKPLKSKPKPKPLKSKQLTAKLAASTLLKNVNKLKSLKGVSVEEQLEQMLIDEMNKSESEQESESESEEESE